MPPLRRPLRVALVLLAVAGPAGAHDFWIEPDAAEPAVGGLVRLRLLVGHGTEREEYPRTERHLVRFWSRGPGGEAEVPGLAGVSPAGLLRPAKPGLHVVAYRSRPTKHVMEAAAFEAYLAEEGLDEALRVRRERGHADRPGREAFSRCAKALLAVGGSAEGAFRERSGLDLELLPLENPCLLVPPADLPLSLLWKGEGAPGVRVSAYLSEDPAHTVAGRTDEEGRVRLRLGKPGRWIVRSVHIRAVEGDPETDWESTWASLTFTVRPPPPPEDPEPAPR
jgi:uncharacterized GH25 family protein